MYSSSTITAERGQHTSVSYKPPKWSSAWTWAWCIHYTGSYQMIHPLSHNSFIEEDKLRVLWNWFRPQRPNLLSKAGSSIAKLNENDCMMLCCLKASHSYNAIITFWYLSLCICTPLAIRLFPFWYPLLCRSGAVQISDVSISGCHLSHAIEVSRCPGPSPNITISSSDVSNNKVTNGTGAISVAQGCNLVLDDVRMVGNQGGALVAHKMARATLSNCVFFNNSEFGAAVLLDGAVLSAVNSTFIGNAANEFGGALNSTVRGKTINSSQCCFLNGFLERC